MAMDVENENAVLNLRGIDEKVIRSRRRVR